MNDAEETPKGFMDRVYDFLGIENVALVAEQAPEEASLFEPPAKAEPRRSRIVSMPGARRSGETQGLNVVVEKPASFDEVQQVADRLKNRQPIILSVELVPKDVARRLVDFVSGAAYALDGRMHRLGESLFLFTPSNIGIDVAGHIDER